MFKKHFLIKFYKIQSVNFVSCFEVWYCALYSEHKWLTLDYKASLCSSFETGLALGKVVKYLMLVFRVSFSPSEVTHIS